MQLEADDGRVLGVGTKGNSPTLYARGGVVTDESFDYGPDRFFLSTIRD